MRIYGFCISSVVLALNLLVSNAAVAEEFPGKVIRIVLPSPPGGSADLTSRTLANSLQKRLNTNVIVENRPGAGGQIGVEAVMNAPADGNTLLVTPNGYVTVMGGFRAGFPDPRKALAAISKIANVPAGLAINPSVPASTLEEFIKFARARPDVLNYAVSNIGSHMHLVGEMFKRETGVKMVAVPYKGTGPATAAVVAGQVEATVSDLFTLLPLFRSGHIRILALTDSTRSSLAPDLPTAAEAGVPGFGLGAWIGLFAPAGTPPEVVARLNREVTASLNEPDVQRVLKQVALDPTPTTAKEMSDIVDHDLKLWAQLVKDAGIKFQ